jgi:hypothetical protein
MGRSSPPNQCVALTRTFFFLDKASGKKKKNQLLLFSRYLLKGWGFCIQIKVNKKNIIIT